MWSASNQWIQAAIGIEIDSDLRFWNVNLQGPVTEVGPVEAGRKQCIAGRGGRRGWTLGMVELIGLS